MKKRYGVLAAIGTVLEIVSWLAMLFGIIGGVISMTGRNADMLLSVIIIASSILIGLLLLAFAHLIHVFIDIEANTRTTAEYFRQRMNR